MENKERLDLVASVYKDVTERDSLQKEADQILAQVKELDQRINDKKAVLLSGMEEDNTNELANGDVIANVFQKVNSGITDEKGVLSYLKDSYEGKYVKVKSTESIDKVALKKALKTDTILAEALKPMMKDTITKYVVVTDLINHQHMLEHINEGVSKSK